MTTRRSNGRGDTTSANPGQDRTGGRGPRRVEHKARGRSDFSVNHAVLAAHLTSRDRWLLRMLAEHRVLTTRHLVPLAFPSPRAAQLRLATLARLGVITSFRPLIPLGSAPAHWVLDTPGRAVLAAEDGLPPPTVARRDRAAVIAHSQQLGHQLGVNTCLTTLATTSSATRDGGGAARAFGSWVLDTWWGQARCTRHFGDHARPDAYAQLTHHHPPATDHHAGTAGEMTNSGLSRLTDTGTTTGTTTRTRRVAWFLEYDTGTEPLRRLGAKLPGYRELAHATAITTPVLFWLPSPAREHHAREVLARILAQLAHAERRLLPIATASPATRGSTADLTPSSMSGAWCDWHPEAPIWAPVQTLPPWNAPRAATQSERDDRGPEPNPRRRLSLIELAYPWSATNTHRHAHHSDAAQNPDLYLSRTEGVEVVSWRPGAMDAAETVNTDAVPPGMREIERGDHGWAADGEPYDEGPSIGHDRGPLGDDHQTRSGRGHLNVRELAPVAPTPPPLRTVHPAYRRHNS